RRHTRFSRDWSSDVCSSDLVFADQLEVAADSAARHDDNAGFIFEFANHIPIAVFAPAHIRRRQYGPVNTRDGITRFYQTVDLVAPLEYHETFCNPLVQLMDKRFDQSWTRPPRDVKARHRIPMPFCQIAAPFRPTDDREKRNPFFSQPCPFF